MYSTFKNILQVFYKSYKYVGSKFKKTLIFHRESCQSGKCCDIMDLICHPANVWLWSFLKKIYLLSYCQLESLGLKSTSFVVKYS